MQIKQILNKIEDPNFREWYSANRSAALENYVALGFSDAIWYLPEGAPPFTKIEQMNATFTLLENEWKRMKIFHSINGVDTYPTMKKVKRESLFIDILDGVHVTEAMFLIAVKDKFAGYPHLDNIQWMYQTFTSPK